MNYRLFKRLAFSIAMLFPAMVVAQPCTCPQQSVRGTGPALSLTELFKGKKSPGFPKDPVTGLDSLIGRLHYADLRHSSMAGSDWMGLKVIVTGRSLRIPASANGVVISLTPCIDSIPGRRQVINASLEMFPEGIVKTQLTPTGPVITCSQAFKAMMLSSEMDWPSLLRRIGDMQQELSGFQAFIGQLAKQVKLGSPGKKEQAQDYFDRLSEAIKASGGNIPDEAYAYFLRGLEGKGGSISEAFIQAAQGIFQDTRARMPQLPGETPQPRYVLKADIGRMGIEFPATLLSSKEPNAAAGKVYSYLFPVRDLNWTDLDGITAETGAFSCGPSLQVGNSGLTIQTGQAIADVSPGSSPLTLKYCGKWPTVEEDLSVPADLKAFAGVYWPSGTGQILLKKDKSIQVQFRHVFADADAVRGKLYITCQANGKSSFSQIGPDGSETDFTISKLKKSLQEQGFAEIDILPVDLLGNGQFTQVRIDFLYTKSE